MAWARRVASKCPRLRRAVAARWPLPRGWATRRVERTGQGALSLSWAWVYSAAAGDALVRETSLDRVRRGAEAWRGRTLEVSAGARANVVVRAKRVDQRCAHRRSEGVERRLVLPAHGFARIER